MVSLVLLKIKDALCPYWMVFIFGMYIDIGESTVMEQHGPNMIIEQPPRVPQIGKNKIKSIVGQKYFVNFSSLICIYLLIK